MLYEAYQAQRDALAPLRFFAETARSLIGQSGPIIGNLPLVRGTAAALTLLSRTGISHERAPFGIAESKADGPLLMRYPPAPCPPLLSSTSKPLACPRGWAIAPQRSPSS